ncbi:hypothetical protein AAFF_G00220890 [Aldrovandia affinis]|uniref:DHHA2 domain-containing protein n=1 Tax=Aldrovandia affinis TaxID=143900 RepID=A0AAD7RFT1_9TELE|nr:hypothetical protein AAFF_G00220890 [Aldrovandia affinis]
MEYLSPLIDHHQLERAPSPSCPVTVETVGSCATLVAERIAQTAPEVLDRQVAQLLYGAVLLDCVNMAPEAGKVTPKDSQYAALLEARFPDLPPRAALFQALQTAKFDVSGLSTEQMLLKDMYMTLAFLQRRGLQQELCEFCHKHRFNLVVAMTICFNENNEPFRQLAVYSSSTLYREEVSHALEKAQNPCLNLSPMSSPYADVKAYRQGNTLASRKKLLPIVQAFLRDWEQRAAGSRGDGDSEDLEEEELEDGLSGPAPSPGADEEPRPRRYSALVEGCPLDNGMPRLSAEAVRDKFSRMATTDAGSQGAL